MRSYVYIFLLSFESCEVKGPKARIMIAVTFLLSVRGSIHRVVYAKHSIHRPPQPATTLICLLQLQIKVVDAMALSNTSQLRYHCTHILNRLNLLVKKITLHEVCHLGIT